METLDPFVTPLVAAVAVFLVHFLSQGRFRELGARIDAVSGELGAKIDAVIRELEQVRVENRDLRAGVDSVRSDLTQLALALGARSKPNAG